MSVLVPLPTRGSLCVRLCPRGKAVAVKSREWAGATDLPNPKAKPRNKCGCRSHIGTRKESYTTQARALDAAITLATTVGGMWRPYKCPKRNRWHLTTKEAP